jgi:hypothetical protein
MLTVLKVSIDHLLAEVGALLLVVGAQVGSYRLGRDGHADCGNED